MAEYRLATADPDGPVVHNASNTNVPNDPANREWMVYRFWCARGHTPDPFVPQPAPHYDPEIYPEVLEGKQPP